MNIVRTDNLTKIYNKKVILDEINLKVKQGDIYALIGENGAGKTTLLRLLAGQIKASSGQIIYGRKELNLGALIEQPAFYPYLSAQENLTCFALQLGIKDLETRVAEVLSLVGLSVSKTKKVADFSLGMWQRLGLAIGLLNRPDFLILDEPINGLDPEGIVEIRNLIKYFNSINGMTLLISSHLLSELSLVANRFGFLHQGKLIAELTKKEVEEISQSSIIIRTSDNKRSAAKLQQEGFLVDNCDSDTLAIRVKGKQADMARIGKLIAQEGIYLSELSLKQADLENFYLELMESESN